MLNGAPDFWRSEGTTQRSSLLAKPQFWALLPLVYLALLSTWVGFDNLVARLVNDDQSYYILVAHNLYARGPSYDGLYLTNGVHPLFTALLGALYVLPVPFGGLAAASVLTCVLFGCGFVLVLLRAGPAHLATRIGIVALASSIAVYPILYRGMEGALAVLVIGVYLTAARRGQAGTRLWCVASVALWAARLELLALPPLVILLGYRASCLRPGQARGMLTGWCCSLVAFALYASASYRWIGLALPVSGLIKQSSVTILPNFVALGICCAVASIVLEAVPRLRRSARRAWMTHCMLSFAAVFYLAHAWGQQDTERQTWYYFPVPALLAFGLFELGGTLPAWFRRGTAAFALAVAAAATFWEGSFVIPLRGEAWRAMRSVADAAKRAAGPGERFMGPGWMALLVGPEFEPFSQDGLVGGAAQYRAIREGRLMEFAYASGVRFLVMSSPAPAALVPPQVQPSWQLTLVSEGPVPNGGSLWASLGRGDQCGLGRCESFLAIYRLSPARTDVASAGLHAAPTPRAHVLPGPS